MANTYDTYKAVQNAIQVGQAWGEQEVAAWFASHDGSMDSAPAWTRGAYCGELPDAKPFDFRDYRKLLATSHDGRYSYWLAPDRYVYQFDERDEVWIGWICAQSVWEIAWSKSAMFNLQVAS